MTDKNNKPPSQVQNHPPESEKKDTINNNSTLEQWAFGYPECVNKKQSRLVCLHRNCQKYPFFCSSCEDESCEKQHTHKDRITSIGFKELIRRLITQRKPPEDLQKSVSQYKDKLQQLLKGVSEFVQKETSSMDQVLRNSFNIDGQQAFVVQKLKEKRYSEIKGKQLDKVWNKVAPSQHKQKMEKEMIKFIDSKRAEVEELTTNFKDGINSVNESKKSQNPQNPKNPQNTQNQQNSQNPQNPPLPQKTSSQASNHPPSTDPKQPK